MKPFANASESPQTSPFALARFAVNREHCGKHGASRLCAMSTTRANQEQEKLAELTHEQLWQVCQRKPGRLCALRQAQATDSYATSADIGACSGGCKWYHTLSGPASLDWGMCGNPQVAVPDCLHSSIRGVPNLSRSDKL